MEKRYQVFVSSTFVDLQSERNVVRSAILDLGHFPAGMEMFPATDTSQLDYIFRVIDQSDYYVLVIGGRYGSIDEQGVSFTEREYDYAVETGRTVLAFVHAKPDEIPAKYVELAGPAKEKLEQFTQKVSTGRLVKLWNDAADLQSGAIIALTHAFRDSPQIGWVRGDRVPEKSTLEDLAILRQTNLELEQKLSRFSDTVKAPPPDAAGLLDTVTLPVRYKPYEGASPRSSNWTVSYLEILKIIGDKFMLGYASEAAVVELERRFKKQNDHHYVDIDNDTVKDVLLQLHVIGMLSMTQGKSTEGRFFTFYSLTPEGRKTYVESKYVRKPPIIADKRG